MTKQDALHLLNLQEGASTDEIATRFNELYSDYQMRLTNAPTPNLKKLYQKNLQELEHARDLLLTGAVGLQGELPSASPVFTESSGQSSGTANLPPPPVVKVGKTPVAKKEKKGNPTAWIVVSLAFAAIAALLGILWMDEKSKTAASLAELESLQPKLQQLQVLDAHLTNGKLKVQNAGSSDLTVTAVTVVYRDNKDQLVKFEDFIGKAIRPGNSMAFERVAGDDVAWDGSAVFYSFDVMYRGEFYHLAGAWNLDSKDGVMKINLDNL